MNYMLETGLRPPPRAMTRVALVAENLLLTTVGLVIGLVLALVINQWLMQHYELPRLPWAYLLVAAGLMLLLGQLAVAAPALRAAQLPPASATRSV